MGNILKNNYDNDKMIIVKELTKAKEELIHIKKYLIPEAKFFRFKKEKEVIKKIRSNLISLQLTVESLRDRLRTN